MEIGTDCDLCGYNQRTCDSTCQWGGWTCVNQGVCNPGLVDIGTGCTMCGHNERVCTSMCQWGNWTCVDQGVCNPGQVDNGGGCTMCGHEQRICSSSCAWGGWSCVNQGACNPGDVEYGATCEGTGQEQRTCQAGCTWGGWTCVGGCGATGHLGNGENGDSCNDPAETWRCVYSAYWSTWVSQVCRSSTWQNFVLNPPDCAGCCGTYSLDCGTL
jgi:hypothetical protein